MIKYLPLETYDKEGNPTTVEIHPDTQMQKVARYESLMQEMRDYIADIKPVEGKAFLLIAAMGDQNWGPNKNADFWPTEALSHKGHDYGYLTYEDNGHWYHQHNNKDVANSYGKVVKSIYNPQMCRIELIVEVDLKKDDSTKKKLESGAVIQVSMGCFEAGTEIWTQHCHGEPIESITPGRIVYGHDGKVHVVKSVSKKPYSGDIYSIGVTSRDTISCTADHPIYVVRKDALKPRQQPSVGKAEWIKAKDLQRGDYAIYPIDTMVSEPDYVDKWYAKLVGYYLAEGSSIKTKSGRTTGIRLSCNRQDRCPEEISEICSNLKDSPTPNIYEYERTPHVLSIAIYNEEITQHVVSDCGELARHKYLSRDVFLWSDENIKWMLGAYIDGDGCVNDGKWQKGSISISTSSKRLAMQLANLLAKLGIVASVNCCNHKPSTIVKKSTIEWIVFIGKTHTHKLLGYSSKLDAGYVKPENYINPNWVDDNYLYLKIKSVAGEYKQTTVYNLEVEESNSYIANGIAVHNSNVGYDICKVCHPNWMEFYKIPEPDMLKLAASTSLKEVYEIGKRNGVDLSYITELNPDGGPVGIHSKISKYCHHMKYQRNKLLPTGERVCVVNMRPKLFDISDVGVNADKSAFVLDKVASIAEDNDEAIAQRLAENEKKAAQKQAIEDKNADIDKEVPGEVVSDDSEAIKEYYAKRILPEIVPYEKEMPDEIVDMMARKYSLGEILSTFMIMGMFPHPREFQRVVLIQSGEREALKGMSNPDNVLTPAIVNAISQSMGDSIPELDIGISHENIKQDLGKILEQFMAQRSYYKPHVSKRIIMIKRAEYGNVNSYMVPDQDPPKVIPALLAAVGGIYLAAKLTGDKGLNDLVSGAIQNKGKVLAGLAGSALLYSGVRAHGREMDANAKFNRYQEVEKQRRMAEDMQKTSAFGQGVTPAALSVLGAYLWAGHSINKAQRGQDPGPIGTFVAKYPLVAGTAGAAMVNPTTRSAILGTLGRKAPAIKQSPKAPTSIKNILYPTMEIAAPIVGTHMVAANTINKANEGRPYNRAEAFITKHPLAVGAAGATLLTPALRKFVVGLGKDIVKKGSEDKMLSMHELTPLEQDRLICAYWEYGDNV